MRYAVYHRARKGHTWQLVTIEGGTVFVHAASVSQARIQAYQQLRGRLACPIENIGVAESADVGHRPVTTLARCIHE